MLPYLCRVAFFYMAKKKYSKKTLNAARDYGKLLGWKRLSSKRVKNFLETVKELTGYVNIQNIVKVSKSSKKYTDSENVRYLEAAKRWAQFNRPTWNRIEKEELKEFMDNFIQYAKNNNVFINAENALDYANSFLIEPEIDLYDLDFEDDRVYIVRNMAGFSDSDVIDSFLKMPTLFNAKIIDETGVLKYTGVNRKEFWDSFRDLTMGNRFPIYNAFYQYIDSNKNEFELTIEVTSYYG